MGMSFEYCVGDCGILAKVLRKHFQISYNHCFLAPFSSEQIDCDLFSWISAYFLMCHSLLKQCLQKGQMFESAWWSPLQLEHLKVWGHSSPFLVSSLGGLILALALQHQPNSLWCSDLWGPLHLIYFAPWMRHEKVEWPYFQQFLHWETPRFMLAFLIIVMLLPTLKHLLISSFVFWPLCTSQISNQTMAMSDLGEILMILGLDAREMLSKIWFCFRMVLISEEVSFSWEFR